MLVGSSQSGAGTHLPTGASSSSTPSPLSSSHLHSAESLSKASQMLCDAVRFYTDSLMKGDTYVFESLPRLLTLYMSNASVTPTRTFHFDLSLVLIIFVHFFNIH